MTVESMFGKMKGLISWNKEEDRMKTCDEEHGRD
jgi:hypothetical protein